MVNIYIYIYIYAKQIPIKKLDFRLDDLTT